MKTTEVKMRTHFQKTKDAFVLLKEWSEISRSSFFKVLGRIPCKMINQKKIHSSHILQSVVIYLINDPDDFSYHHLVKDPGNSLVVDFGKGWFKQNSFVNRTVLGEVTDHGIDKGYLIGRQVAGLDKFRKKLIDSRLL
jgi:hypothetical protein